MDITLFLAGLLLTALGTGVFLHTRVCGPFTAPASTFWALGGFALLHGSHQWVLLAQDGARLGSTPSLLQSLLLLLTALLLLEFGRVLLRVCAASAGSSAARTLARGLGRRPFVLVVLVALAAIGLAPEWRVACRYLLLLPATLLAGAGLLWYPHTPMGLRSAAPAWAYILAGSAFLGLALAEGLLVPAAPVFPANLLNEQSFAALTGLSPEDLRSALSAVAAGALLLVLVQTQRQVWSGMQDAMERLRNRAAAQGQVLQNSRDAILEVNGAGRVQLANPAARQLFGMQELEGAPLAQLVAKLSDRQAALVDTSPGGRHAGSLSASARDMSPATPAFRCRRVQLGNAPSPEAPVLVSLQPTQETEQLRFAALVVEEAPEGFLILDSQARVMAMNRRFREATGFGPEALIGRRPKLFEAAVQGSDFLERVLKHLETNESWQGEVWNRHQDGSARLEWLTINRVQNPDGTIRQLVAVFSDIRDQKEVQARLHYLAYYDGLTGLPNRELFSDHLKLALVRARREHHLVALMFLDLDRFKNINDTLGHQMGDRVLSALAGRLRESVREGDTIARLGGDEFTVILPDLDSVDDAATVAEKILNGFSSPLGLDEQEFHLTASIGISIAPRDGEEIDTLLKNADTAMYQAKELGRNNYQFYTADMSARFSRWVALENDLRLALQSGSGLSMVYQPQLDIHTGRIVGVEALVRWQHKRLGDIPPASFIPIAEDSGLIAAVGEWVLRTACRDAKQWVERCGDEFRLAVNLSAHQLGQGDFVALVARVLEETGLEAKHLELELTETVLMTNAEATHAILHALNQMGIQLSIDDFGTGYSSLGYLKQFTIDKLKIDQSFVRDVASDPNDATIATSIIAMAHKLNLKVIAEGVETQEQLDFLRHYGCDQIQGFLFSRPSKAPDVGRFLREAVTLH